MRPGWSRVGRGLRLVQLEQSPGEMGWVGVQLSCSLSTSLSALASSPRGRQEPLEGCVCGVSPLPVRQPVSAVDLG